MGRSPPTMPSAKELRESGRVAAHPKAHMIDAAGDAEDSEEEVTGQAIARLWLMGRGAPLVCVRSR